MKKLLLPLLAGACLFSCKKDNSPAGPSGKLVSVRAYLNTQELVRLDTFIYNSNGYLEMQRETDYGPGLINPGVGTVSFSYAGSSADPSSYTVADGYGTTTYALTYDSQGQLAKDTAAPDPSGRSSTFYYATNAIIYNSTGHATTDTLYLANNNIVKTVEASVPPGRSAVSQSFSFSPTYANPFYTVGHNQNFRILLDKIDNWELYPFDFISRNALTGITRGGSTYGMNYTADASGKVVRDDYSTGGYLIFTYQ